MSDATDTNINTNDDDLIAAEAAMNAAEATEAVAEEPKQAVVPATETPKPVRVARKRTPKVEVKEAPKEAPAKRGRPKAELEDGGPLVQSTDFPADLRFAGKLPSYRTASSTRQKNRMSNLREDPLVAGSIVNPALIFDESELDALKAVWAKRVDFPAELDFKSILFLGTDPRGNVDWLIGTKGDRIVRLRQSKDNAISYANVSVTDAQKAYNLAFAFDANFFDYWQHDLTIQQYKLGALAAARKAEQVKAREAEAKAKAAKTAPKPSAPAAKKTTVRVTRKSKASTASK